MDGGGRGKQCTSMFKDVVRVLSVVTIIHEIWFLFILHPSRRGSCCRKEVELQALVYYFLCICWTSSSSSFSQCRKQENDGGGGSFEGCFAPQYSREP